MVILFGSWATAQHREHSDVDLLVIAGDNNPLRAKLSAEHTAWCYVKGTPPKLEVNVIGMTRKYFDHSDEQCDWLTDYGVIYRYACTS